MISSVINPNNYLSNPVGKLSAKLQDEIGQIEVREKELNAKEDTIQAEHTKIHHAEQELQAEHTKLERQRSELEYRLQGVKNEV
ncbi:hypothetical protein [Allocoleopsis sp.]|uniref:hypothetical protein n=1 Tax=Allocoleopsis sp. TaxID=3088169 RepID=UPI002FD2BA0C